MTVETGEQMRALLIEHYTMIENTRMEGVPILNKALSVAALGFEPYNDYQLGIMLTPWFMNLMMVPLEEGVIDTEGHKFGSTQQHMLPSGQFAFIVGHEQGIGSYLSCSLYSPVYEFADQQAFEETARSALDEVLTPIVIGQEPDESNEALSDAEMREIWAGRLPESVAPHPQERTIVSTDAIDPNAIVKVDRPVRTIPSLSSEMSRRDLLRGMRAPESEKESS